MMNKNEKIVICGAGGFIGGHLIAGQRQQRLANLRAIDLKPLTEWYQRFPDVENLVMNLQDKEACYCALQGASDVYNLAADMGGMGFIETHRALCRLSVLITSIPYPDVFRRSQKRKRTNVSLIMRVTGTRLVT